MIQYYQQIIQMSSKTSKKSNNVSQRVAKFKSKNEIDHIIDRSDMYVGFLKRKQFQKYVASKTSSGTWQINKEIVSVSEAFAKTFMEGLSNAADNVYRSLKEDTPCTKIKVNLNEETGETSIWNDGRSIPIEKTEDGIYVHTMIFGMFRTGENYDDKEEREGIGRNGYGVKLLNVFSKNFEVSGVDPISGKKIVQKWSNNMRDRQDPVITDSKLKNGYTKISWTPDFEKFGMKKYNKDIISLLYKYVIDVAMTTGVSVYINDEKIPVKNLLEYSRLYTPYDDEWNSDTESVTSSSSSSKNEKIYIKTKKHEVVLLPNYNGEHNSISFVNGAYTSDNGVHVDAWSEAIFRPIVEKINKKNTSTKGGKTIATRPHINIKDVKSFFYLFVSVSVPNPQFESQSKCKLEAPEVKAIFPVTKINQILKWGTSEMIEDIIISKERASLRKSTPRKKGFVKVDKLSSANKEGPDSILILTEGDSAATYATTGVSTGALGRKGRDYFGIFPLRGKILNARKASPKQLSENKVLNDLNNILGLRYGVDYTNDKEYKTLKYGTIMTLTDADVDGLHILGLILNWIHTLFPSLLKRPEPYVVHMGTPIAKINKLDRVFFDEREYNEFMRENENKYKAKYYKGLGTSGRTEVKETFGQKIIKFKEDNSSDSNMCKVFHGDKGLSDLRKKWLATYDPLGYKQFDNGKGISDLDISDFLNHYMIQFSLADCERNIPSLMDGFKQTQRKVFYGCRKRNLKSDVKVASLAGYITEQTKYHHGEVSLQDTIKSMASCYTGGNNIPLLARSGEMGSRIQGGKDSASARYVETHLESISQFLFSDKDDALLTRRIDDGEMVEPEFYVPCIPFVLANPCKGAIGTGWSSTIPSYNPKDLIECVKLWLNNDGCAANDEGNSIFPNLVPWYRGFKGEITKKEDNKFVSYGVLERLSDKTVIVKELPIGLWTEDFESFLQSLKADKKIKTFRINYTVSEIYFEIDEIPGGIKLNENTLKLSKPINATNMVLFNQNNKLQKFRSTEEIIDQFCRTKYEYMVKRKQYLLKTWKKELDINMNKKRFINDIITKKLEIFQKEESEVISDMEKLGYTKISTTNNDEKGYEYLLRLHMRSFTKNKLQEIQKEIEKLEAMIKDLEKTSERKLWLQDLKQFETAYDKLLVDLKKELDQPVPKSNKKKSTKK